MFSSGLDDSHFHLSFSVCAFERGGECRFKTGSAHFCVRLCCPSGNGCAPRTFDTKSLSRHMSSGSRWIVLTRTAPSSVRTTISLDLGTIPAKMPKKCFGSSLFCLFDMSLGVVQSTVLLHGRILPDGAFPSSLWHAVGPSVPTLCLVMIVLACCISYGINTCLLSKRIPSLVSMKYVLGSSVGCTVARRGVLQLQHRFRAFNQLRLIARASPGRQHVGVTSSRVPDRTSRLFVGTRIRRYTEQWH